MASIALVHAIIPANSIKASVASTIFLGSTFLSQHTIQKTRERKQLTVVAAAGDVSSDGTIYLIVGAAAVALLGTAFPVLFSRKDTCPECDDGAGFVRKSGATLRANSMLKFAIS